MGKTTIHYEMLQIIISQRSYIITSILDANNIKLTSWIQKMFVFHLIYFNSCTSSRLLGKCIQYICENLCVGRPVIRDRTMTKGTDTSESLSQQFHTEI